MTLRTFGYGMMILVLLAGCGLKRNLTLPEEKKEPEVQAPVAPNR